MGVITGFFKQLENNWIRQVLFCIVSMVVLFVVYISSMIHVKNYNMKKEIQGTKLSVDYNTLTYLNDVVIDEKQVVFSGSVLRMDSKNIFIKVILKNIENGEEKILKTEIHEDDLIKKYFLLEEYYENCGFSARITNKDISAGECYEILIAFEYERDDLANKPVQELIKISTNKYFYEGDIYRYNPASFTRPIVNSKELNDVIEHGELYLYSADKKVWVYEFSERLFCIADSRFFVPLDENPSVPVTIYTLNGELVPEERREQYYENGFDSLEVYINESHFMKEPNGTYYVTAVELPDYPITYIRTGTYANRGAGWIYKGEFQVDIEVK